MCLCVCVSQDAYEHVSMREGMEGERETELSVAAL